MTTQSVCSVNHIDHVGVAVKDIDAALKFFQEVFGAPAAEIQTLEDQGVRATLIEVGQTRLELLEPLSDDGPVGRFIERRGEGLHHLALNVTGLRDALRENLFSQLILGEYLAGDYQSLYFRRTFIDGGNPGIPEDALHPGVLKVTYAAMNLHRLG